ncbi:MAG: tetratricopeptide repeat protein [Saprospiraceae bacterium]|nr:tetratricopeptide repeat protein [Saprospiraceae bacterium]
MAKKKRSKKKPSKRKPAPNQAGWLQSYRLPLLLAALIAIVFAAYSPVLNADFVDMDDQKLILDKSREFNWKAKYFIKYGFGTPYYKPVTYLTWRAEFRAVGADAWLFHLNNLLLHLANTLLVFFIARRLAQQFDKVREHALPVAFFTALLFGLHPLHVESVAWVVERKDVLFTLFYLLGILGYMRYLDTGKWVPLLLSALAYMLSIFSKAPGITLIAVLFLFDVVWRRPFSLKLITEKLAHLGVFGFALYAFGVFGSAAQEGSIAALRDTDRKLAAASNLAEQRGVWGKTTLASMRGVLWYLHSWLPFRTSLGYPREAIIGFFGVLINIFPVILAVGAAALVWLRKKHRLLFFAHAFFFITLSPSIARLGLGIGIFMSDRYVYLPVLGLMFLLAAWIYTLRERGVFNLRTKHVVLAAIGLLFVIMTFNGSKTWQNTETLWTNVIEKYPNVAYAYVNRGSYYRDRGQLDQALADLSKAIELDDNANARIQRGLIYRQLGQSQNALTDYTQAITLDPDNTQAYTNRGNIYLDMRRFPLAIQDYSVSLNAHPRDPRTLVNRAIAHASLRDYTSAQQDFARAEEINPNYAQIYGNRAIMFFEMGRYRRALTDYQRHLQFYPDDHQIMNDTGVTLQALGRHQEAIEHFTRAIALHPDRRYFQARARSYEAIGREDLAAQDRLK